jgi:hypothetical protein
MLRRVALVRTDVSKEPSTSFIRVTRIGELGTTLAVTSNRGTLRRNTMYFFAAFYVPQSDRTENTAINGYSIHAYVSVVADNFIELLPGNGYIVQYLHFLS